MNNRRTMDAGLDLLDRQVLDREGLPIGKVDDVELSQANPSEDAPHAAALLLGPLAYGHRLGGRLGSSIAGAGARLGRHERPLRIPMEMVKSIGVSVTLAVSLDEVDRAVNLDQWLRDHFIARIPGAGNATE
ncbi:MAG: hypothetical protein M3285_00115 [Actinomycetota bacterium]|nr:hypothetical protein [Actinomycetota bacterium]